MKRMMFAPLCIALILAAGCSTSPKCSAPAPAVTAMPAAQGATALEGSWDGHELTPGHEGLASLVVHGDTLEYHGADDNIWLKGTIVLYEDTKPKRMIGTVTDCAAADYIGQKSYSIYKIEDGDLIITGSQIGVTNFPESFGAADASQFVFSRKK